MVPRNNTQPRSVPHGVKKQHGVDKKGEEHFRWTHLDRWRGVSLLVLLSFGNKRNLKQLGKKIANAGTHRGKKIILFNAAFSNLGQREKRRRQRTLDTRHVGCMHNAVQVLLRRVEAVRRAGEGL